MLAAVLDIEDESFKYRLSLCLVGELRHKGPDISFQISSKGKPNGMVGDSSFNIFGETVACL